MVKIRTLVPLTHPTTNEEFPADTEVDVADDVAQAWQAAGKVSLPDVDQANAEAATHYTDVTGRDDVATPQPGEQLPGPQADTKDDDEDQPRSRAKGKR